LAKLAARLDAAEAQVVILTTELNKLSPKKD
jgi:hypothetical protein